MNPSYPVTETRPALYPKLALKPWISKIPAVTLINATIVDPATGTLSQNPQTIKISGGTIVSIDTTSEHDLFAKDTVDLKGLFACPGLIDCHVHACVVPGVTSVAEFASVSEETIRYRTVYVLKEMLERGFTTVRDAGGATKHLANAVAEGLVQGPRLIQCGRALSQTGGHGDFTQTVSGGLGDRCCGGHTNVSIGRVVDGVPEVLRAVRDELKAGADFIKIMVGGGVASATDSIESVQFTSEEIRAITTTCDQMGGFLSTAHAYTDRAIRHAIDNGVKGIEHGNLMSGETARYMAEKGTYLTPTLSVHGAISRPPFDAFLPQSSKEKNKEMLGSGLHAIKIAHDEGVTICYGSDMLAGMHALQTEEFSVRAAILPSPAILKHATTNAAKMLGLEGQIGSISEGAWADLILLDRNPLDDVTILDRPEMFLKGIIKEGRWVKQL